MFIVSVSHHVKPGRIEDAKAVMTRAAAGMVEQDGFLFRFLVTAVDDLNEITSFTAWESEAHMQRSLDAFRASGAPWPDPSDPSSPYLDVTRRHLDAVAFHVPPNVTPPAWGSELTSDLA